MIGLIGEQKPLPSNPPKGIALNYIGVDFWTLQSISPFKISSTDAYQ